MTNHSISTTEQRIFAGITLTERGERLIPTRKDVLQALGAIGATMGLIALVAEIGTEDLHYSTQTETVQVLPGEGLDALIDREVDGMADVSEPTNVRIHVENDPANIDVMRDGLQPGEMVTVPVSVETGL